MHLAQQAEPLAGELRRYARHASDIAAWLSEAGDEAAADMITTGRRHDRNTVCDTTRSKRCLRARGYDDGPQAITGRSNGQTHLS